MDSREKEIGIGVIGFGGFAMFAVQHLVQVPGVKLSGISGTHREAAVTAAKRFEVPLYEEIPQMLERPEVDLVYIATPPFLHYEQSMLALEHGKHVICEKPLAINLRDAEEMIQTARGKNLLMTVNLMQRYNPLYHKIKALIDSKALGDVLHAYFENYASDEFLLPGHWFWDRSKSGGIFIEHGVHFFDMFDGWFGKGKVSSAQSTMRPGANDIEEQVQCQVQYGETILANFYHGFTQPSKLDRQQLRILFEKADVTLHEWVPYKTEINALVNEEETKFLMDLFPEAQLKVFEFYSSHHRKVGYRHKTADVYQYISIRDGFDKVKMNVYGGLVYNMFKDQIEYIRNPGHKRVITEENGYNSLTYAVQAAELAAKG
jgi:predicted dehydrogenase